MLQERELREVTPTHHLEPWPMATNAPIRAVAWPNYASVEEINHVLNVAQPLFGRDDACLCLRHDPEVDIPLEEAVTAVEEAVSALQREEELHVLMIDGQMLRSDWPRIGVNAFCAIQTNQDDSDIRSEFIRSQNIEVVKVELEEE